MYAWACGAQKVWNEFNVVLSLATRTSAARMFSLEEGSNLPPTLLLL